MKYLKTYNENLREIDDSGFALDTIYMDEDITDTRLNAYKFKLGDYVSHILYGGDIFQIIGIDLSDDNNGDYSYRLKSLKDDMDNFQALWAREKSLTFIPEYEIDAIKYNL